MKKIKIMIFTVCIGISISLLFYYKIEKRSNLPSLKEIKIGISVYNQEDIFISSILNCLEEKISDWEKKYKKKITYYIVDGKGNQTRQNDQIDQFIKQNCSVLCINLVDRTAAATIIDKAKAADIPIVFFNREPVEADMKRWDKVYYVGSAPEQAGRMQGEIVLNQYQKDKKSVDRNKDGKIQYVMLEGEPNHQDAAIRSEYCIKPLQEADVELEKLASSCANWQIGQGEEKMAIWLEKYKKKIEVVFSNNDEMALGAILAIKQAGLQGKIRVVGVDAIAPALEAVKNGDMLGTVKNNAKKQAFYILKLAVLLGSRKELPKEIPFDTPRSIHVLHKKIVKHEYQK